MPRYSPGRLKVFGVASVLPGILPLVQPVILDAGERPYFLSVLGTPAGGANGSITIEGQTITVLSGTALTIGGSDWPSDCASYEVQRRVEFVSTLGPVLFMWGPVQRGM